MATDSQLISQAQRLLAQRRYKESAELCIDGLAIAPNDPELLVTLALCDEARGDREGAMERLQAAVAADPRHEAAHFQLGRLEAARGQFERARQLFNQCLALNPNHVAARTLLARLDATEGKRDVAIAGLKSALRADDRHLPTLTTLVELLVDAGQLDQAHEHASRALRLNPDSAAVQMSMARVLLAQGHVAFARQSLDNAIRSAPKDPTPRMMLAALLQRQNQHIEALDVLAETERQGYNGPDRLLAEARSLRRIGRLIDALNRYEHLVAPADASAELVLEAAECCIEAGYSEVAEELLARPGLESSPQSVLLRARLAERAGRHGEAGALAESLHQAQLPAIRTSARMLSTRLALLANDAERAEAELQPLLEAGDAPASVIWMAAEIAQSREDHDRAVALLEALLERQGLDEDSRARTHGMLVHVLDRAERHEAAARHFGAAAWKTPFVGYGLREDSASSDVTPLDPWRWDRQAPDDGRKQPMFLTGWPGSGRELLFSALAASSQLGILPPGSWRLRRGQLGLPAEPARVAAMDEAQARMLRRQFLRRLGEQAARFDGLLEGGQVVADDLAMLARVFPGAILIAPVAEQADLEIYWKLNGFRDVPAMLQAWRRDLEQQQRLAGLLPLNRIEVSLGELFEEPVATFKALCRELGLRPESAMLEAMDRARLESGYRAPGHWQHYQWTD